MERAEASQGHARPRLERECWRGDVSSDGKEGGGAADVGYAADSVLMTPLYFGRRLSLPCSFAFAWGCVCVS